MKQLELQEKLGECIENISSNDITDEELVYEIERSKVMASLAKEMVRNANFIMRAKQAVGSFDSKLVESLI